MKTLFATLFKTHLLKTLAVIFAFLLPIRGLILAVGISIMADTVTGMMKAYKQKNKITSRKLSQIISKMVLYQSALLLFFVIDFFLLGEFLALFVGIQFFLTKVLAAVLCFIELKSIDENYKVITGYSLWQKFKEMLARGKDLKEDIEDLTKKEDE